MLHSKTLRFMSLMAFMMMTLGAYAQQGRIQYFRPYDQRGINVFETSKSDTVKFDGLKLRIGANFSSNIRTLNIQILKTW